MLKIAVDVFHHFPSTSEGQSVVLQALEDLKGEVIKMTEASERLATEVQETKDAVLALESRYQAKIDAQAAEINNLQIALANGDTPAAQAAADALDQLQKDMAGMAQPPAPQPEPVPEPAPAPEGGTDSTTATDTTTATEEPANTIDGGQGEDSLTGGGADETLVQEVAVLTVSPSMLTGTAGQPLEAHLAVTGGVEPYSFESSIAELEVDADANVSGTPANAGTGVITVKDSSTLGSSVGVSVSIGPA